LHSRTNIYTNSSDILPLSSLCIHPAKSAWVLYVDAICINYDGNAFDAALVAMVAALKNSSYPYIPS
jgi:exosome complex component RRP43